MALLTAVLLLASLIPMSGIAPDTAAFADTITGSGYEFDDSTGKLTVTDNSGTTAWKNDASIDADEYSRSGRIKSVVFTNNVTVIGDDAFFRCNNLRSVDFSGCTKLTSIGSQAFMFCRNLESAADFSDCTKLTSIGARAFLLCESLDSVILPASLTSIGQDTFNNCDSFESVDLSGCKKLTSISGGAFGSCDKLDSVIFPASIETIGNAAFSYCSSLASVDLSGCTKLTTIDGWAFSSCESLDNVIFPASLQTIGGSAFYGCSGLDNVIFPESLKTIGDQAFKDCTDLSVLRFLGDAAPTVGTDAFDNISDTGAVYYPKGATGYDVIMSSFPGLDVSGVTSDAGLASVAGRTITAGSQAGTKAAPKTASVSVENSVASIGLSDIAASDSKAAKHIYSDSNFSVNAASISLTAGADTHVYIKVVAEDTFTMLYYDVTVARADATPDVPGGGNTPNVPGGNTPGGDSGQALAKADSIKASQKTIYIAKGKKAVLPYIVYGPSDANQAKITLDWKSSNKNVASVKNTKKNNGSIQAGIGTNQKLVIKAGKKTGKSVITLAAPNGKKLAITVKVVKNAKQVAKQSVKIKNLPKGKTMATGQSRTLNAAFTKNATAIVTWKSSKPGVVKIDASGRITALKKGNVTITLKVGGKTQKAVIRVKN